MIENFVTLEARAKTSSSQLYTIIISRTRVAHHEGVLDEK